MIRILTTLTLTIALASNAFGATCKSPYKVYRGSSVKVYRLGAGEAACLGDGTKIITRKVSKNRASFGISSKRGLSRAELSKYSTDSKKVSGLRLRLSRTTTSNEAVIEIKIDPKDYEDSNSNDSPTVGDNPPVACPYIEGACIEVYSPVCAITSKGEIKKFSNSCFAAVACAQVIEGDC